ncbi:MAG: winged helix-turn-helix transcriptional regulator [Hyphomicrobium sp.]|nr:winged helix-turn-helix transcriptional regulator [Hyphomicrobium sp.]
MDNAKFFTKREFAAEAIRNAIQNGFYQPGEVVSQRRISEDLNLSVTPIREAIIQLAGTGLIERHSHHRTSITSACCSSWTQFDWPSAISRSRPSPSSSSSMPISNSSSRARSSRRSTPSIGSSTTSSSHRHRTRR